MVICTVKLFDEGSGKPIVYRIGGRAGAAYSVRAHRGRRRTRRRRALYTAGLPEGR